MRTAEEIANYFTMKRFYTSSNIKGHDDKEFFDLLTDEIKLYANQKLDEAAERLKQTAGQWNADYNGQKQSILNLKDKI